MTVKYGNFEIPDKILAEEIDGNASYCRFIVQPFERGFAHSLGNTLRRVALTSLEAPAIISIRIEGVSHEYTSVEGVVEDMTDIILNFKGARLRKIARPEEAMRSHRILTMILDVNQEMLDDGGGRYAVTLGRLVQDGYYEVVNPDLLLFTVTKPFKRQIDLRVAVGRGYVPSERHEIEDRTLDEISIDSIFTPVLRANYFVKNTRVGQDTDFDSLILEILTDGRISPKEALNYAAQICIKHFEVFRQIDGDFLEFEQESDDVDSDRDELLDKLALRIDEIELSVRSANCLAGASIRTIGELVSIPERKLLEFRNFGKKSLNEIKEKLSEMRLSLGMDLSRYKLTPQNLQEKIDEYLERKKAYSEQGG